MDGAPAVERLALRVLLATNAADRQRVRDFRDHALRQEMGTETDARGAPSRRLHAELAEMAEHYFIEQGGEIRAALWQISSAEPSRLPQAMRAALMLDRFEEFHASLSVTGPPVVAKYWPAGEAAALLLAAAFKAASQHAREIDFTHCELANTGLYQKLGYRRYAPHFYDGNERVRTPLLLLLKDLSYLRSANSPFARLAASSPNDRAAANWFSRNFPEATAFDGKRLRDEERFWHSLTKRLQQSPLVSIPLFRGLSYPDALRFLNQAKLLALEAGDCLVRAGSTGHEMFVVLAGRLDVMVDRAEGRHRLASMGPGELAGEIGFLTETCRSADLVAGEPSEILVLTQSSVRRAMDEIPKVAASVLLHLSLLLCERLRDSSRDLLDGSAPSAA